VCAPSCGSVGQSCCDDGTCGMGAVCLSGACVACGDRDGAPCCPSGPACVGAALTCEAGTCRTCGGTNERCCDNPSCYSLSNACTGTESGPRCLPCGAGGQVCCSARPGRTACDAPFQCASPPRLDAGSCQRCGAEGEQCCVPGRICNGGLSCSVDHPGAASQCARCGLRGTPCCAGSVCSSLSLVCDPTNQRCEPCGQPGERCCAGARPCEGETVLCTDGRCR
jgi:hypothetical protein